MTVLFAQSQKKKKRSYARFQQNSATAHITRDYLAALGRVFGDRIISCGLWPERSPDLTPHDFYLCDNLKDKVCRTNPNNKEELKENIRREILKVPQEERLQTNFNMFKLYRVGVCTRTEF
jgi:hypothetical protein